MKLLLINQTFSPDNAATAQVLTDFAVDLANRKYDVTVLTARRGYSDPKLVYKASEVYSGVKVIRVWPFGLGRKFRIGRVLDAFLLNLSFMWRLFWLPRYDKMVVMTSPPLVAYVAHLFAKWRKSEFIHWMMDINPDEAVLAGWVPRESFQVKMLEKTLKCVLDHSDKIVVLDEFMERRLIEKGADPAKIKVLPPWSHDEDLETISHDRNPFRRQHGLENKFVVMYSGNHSICHPLYTIFNAALFLKDDPSIVFVFIGGGERVENVKKFKKERKLSNIVQLPYQSRSHLKHSLSAADLHITVMGDAFVGIVHSCKIYGILRIGRPFVYIGSENSHVGKLVASERAGYRIGHGDSEKLAAIIGEVKMLDSSQKQKIEEAEKRTAERYSRRNLCGQLIDYVCG